MLSFYFPKTQSLLNKNLQDYCKKTTEDSIRKLTEKYNLERNNSKIDNKICVSSNPEFNFYGILTILSITTIAFIFLRN
jgi:hypothetical protein